MKIFLSHSGTNKALIRAIRAKINPVFDTWLDERELIAGSPLQQSLIDAVQRCDLHFVFLSRAAAKSEWVRLELKAAMDVEIAKGMQTLMPIALPDVEIEALPPEMSGRICLRIADEEEGSIEKLSNEINDNVIRWLDRRFMSLAGGSVGFQKVEEIVDSVRNKALQTKLREVLKAASNLTYFVVGPPEIYWHDMRLIEAMEKGDIYRATHPFLSNLKGPYANAIQYKAYINAQNSAASRGAVIRRLYVLRNDSVDSLAPDQPIVRIRQDLGEASMVDARLISTESLPPMTKDFGQDFVILDDTLVGVGVPRVGEMLASQYRYSASGNEDEIRRYTEFFDMAFAQASPIVGPAVKLVHSPAFTLQTPANINGKPTNRLMVVLRTSGCAYDKNKSGCSMCDFSRHAVPGHVSSDDLLRQLEHGLAQANFGSRDVEQLDLLTLGSFLHDAEVEPAFRGAAFRKLATFEGLKKIVVESRASYFKAERMRELKSLLRSDQILEVGLGIESSNDRIRNEVLRKSLSRPHILNAIHACAESGVQFLAYLLIGSMTLSEKEAVNDAVSSAQWVAKVCREAAVPFRIAFEPVFVTQGTELERLFNEGRYKLINLWRVVDALKGAINCGTLFVGLSDEGLSKNRTPQGCENCSEKLRAALERFNGSQDLSELDAMTCACRSA